MAWEIQFVALLPYILAILFAISVGIQGLRYLPGKDRVAMAINLFSLTIWVGVILMEVLTVQNALKIFGMKLHVVTIGIISATWLVYINTFVHNQRPSRFFYIAIAGSILLASIVIFTNGSHGLIFTRVILSEATRFTSPIIQFGVGMILFGLYAFGMMITAIYLLIQKLIIAQPNERSQIYGMLTVTVIPSITIAIHLLRWQPYTLFSAIPFGVIFTTLIHAINIYNYQRGALEAATHEAIISGLSDGLVILDASNNIQDLNPAARIILELENHEVIGKPLGDFWSGWQKLFTRFQTGLEKNFEISFGVGFHMRTFDVRISNSFDKSGKFACRIVVLSDISDLKQAQNALQKAHDELELRVVERTAELALAESRYRSVMEQSVDVIILVDQETLTILEANPAFQDLLGYPLEGVSALTLYDFIAHEREELDPVISQVTGDKQVIMVEGLFRHHDGSILDVEVGASLISYGDRQAICIVARDIRTRKKAERDLENYARELERSNAELEQFAYVASHDLQEPLRMVTSYVQLLDRRYHDQLDEDASEFISYAAEGAKRMQHLIHDLLNYSRIGAQREPLNPIDCAQVVQAALKNLQVAIRESNAEITCGALPTLRADSGQLVQLFQNLIGNAIKFRCDEPPEIHIAAARSNGVWKFSISDNGIGMDPKHKDKIFRIFQRLHTPEKYPGTGVGLAICKRIVERHGGQIWVDSQIGEGSTIFFTIGTGEPT